MNNFDGKLIRPTYNNLRKELAHINNILKTSNTEELHKRRIEIIRLKKERHFQIKVDAIIRYINITKKELWEKTGYNLKDVKARCDLDKIVNILEEYYDIPTYIYN